MSYLYRLWARKAMKENLQVLLLLQLIAQALMMVAQVIVALTGLDVSVYLTNLAQSMSNADYQATGAALMEEFMRSEGWKGQLITTAATLLSVPLLIGFLRAGLLSLRGQRAEVRMSLEFLPKTLKCIGLYLLVNLLIFLWTLLGGLVMAGVVWLVLQSVPLQANPLPLVLVAITAVCVLGIYVSLRYRMAQYVLADEPDTRLRECIRRSAVMMKGHKLEAIALGLSFFGWTMLAAMVTLLLASMLGNVLGGTLGMFVMLMLNVYVDLAYLAMYDNIRPGGTNLTGQKYLDAMNGQQSGGN